MIYKARKGARIKNEDAQIIGNKLDDMGDVSARDFVNEAHDKESVLHEYLTWNNKKAGQLYREQEARVIIGSITIEITPDTTVRAFIPHPVIQEENEELKKYCNITYIMDDVEELEALIAQAKREAISWWNRYKEYEKINPKWEELQPMFEAMREVIK